MFTDVTNFLLHCIDFLDLTILYTFYLQKGTTHVPAKTPPVSANNSNVQLPPVLMSLVSSATSNTGLFLLFFSVSFSVMFGKQC